jgi:phage terminase large subunit-like protein
MNDILRAGNTEERRRRRRKLAYLKSVDPAAYRELIRDLNVLLDEVAGRDRKRGYEDSFLAFVKRAWQEFDSNELKLNWFHECLIEHMEAVCRGEIRHLIISAPPRCGKSAIISILYPAWVWCRREVSAQSGPQTTFMCVTHSANLSEEMAVKSRRLIWGYWYQSLWHDRVGPMLEDQGSRANFGNRKGGARLSVSLSSGLLGRGADIQICDDPLTVAEAESDLERQTALRNFAESLPTRVTNPATAAKVLVCQRVHEDDITNLAVESWPDDKTWLMFPARYEVNRNCPEDRRTQEGELLVPELWPDEELRKVELGLAGLEKGQAGLSSYAAQAQLQQSPVARGGGVIPRTAWAIWPEHTPRPEDIKHNRNGEYMVELPPVSFVLVSVDTAFSERETSDLNAICVLGIWSRRRELVTRERPYFSGRWGQTIDLEDEAERLADGEEQPRVVVMEATQFRAPLHDPTLDPRTGRPRGLVERILDVCRRRKADRVLIENANRGVDVRNEIRRQIGVHQIGLELFEPSHHGSKLNRMHAVSPLVMSGLVSIPANLVKEYDANVRERVDVREFQWCVELMSQCERTPRGRQDLADAFSSGMLYLRDAGLLAMTPEFVQQELERRAWKPKPFDVARSYGVA